MVSGAGYTALGGYRERQKGKARRSASNPTAGVTDMGILFVGSF